MNEPAASTLRLSDKLDPDVEVERIILNPERTGELKAAGKSGDDRLSVVIEQRDPNDKRVLAPGDVSIVVVDPALEGSAARIARWNFDSDEVAKHVRRNRDGGSLQFELPWQTPPVHSDLRLFVRFTTYDGRRLEANLPIELQSAKSDAAGSEWKKRTVSPATLDEAATEDRTSPSSTDASGDSDRAKKRGVYQAGASTADSSSTDDSPREARQSRPAWSPYR